MVESGEICDDAGKGGCNLNCSAASPNYFCLSGTSPSNCSCIEGFELKGKDCSLILVSFPFTLVMNVIKLINLVGASIQSVSSLISFGSFMFIAANSNQLIRVSTFIGSIRNNYTLDFL
jgi:hypothetical protein